MCVDHLQSFSHLTGVSACSWDKTHTLVTDVNFDEILVS